MSALIHRQKQNMRDILNVGSDMIDMERATIWNSKDASDLILGLPDLIVEMKIWPRLCKYLKDVQNLCSHTAMPHLEGILSYAQISRKW